MKIKEFIGRKKELKKLTDLRSKGRASLVVCKGRRRIGKSTLIEEFAKGSTDFFEFQGLAPRDGIENQTQLDHFAEQLAQQTKLPAVGLQDWNQAFALLDGQISSLKKTVLLLDEISWMAGKDPDFVGKLKTAWDTRLKKHRHLIVVLCGSVSSWIDKNILKNADFVGRISLTLNLEELPYRDSIQFWGKQDEHISSIEKFKVLGVTGGVPKYLEEIHPQETAEKNIQNLCFFSGGLLFNEFEKIFNEIFDRRAKSYRQIVEALADKKLSYIELCEELGVAKGTTIVDNLAELETSGFIARDYVYNFNGKETKLSKYRLKDNYLRFYLKYISPNKSQIQKGIFEFKELDDLSNWETIMGFQFENTLLHNLPYLLKILKIPASTVISASPYFQKKTTRNKGACQIDLLVATRAQSLYICEFKFRKKIGMEVVKEVKHKIKTLSYPKYCSIRPILIHEGEVSEEVRESDFFSQIVEAGRLMEHH